MDVLKNIECYYETAISGKYKSQKIIIKGLWDGEKFTSHEHYGNITRTVVRKKAWLFTIDRVPLFPEYVSVHNSVTL